MRGERRRKLVATARGLYGKRPHAAVTVEAVAEATAVPAGAAAKLFPTPDALLLAVVADALPALLPTSEPPADDPAQALQERLDAIRKAAWPQRHGWRALVRALNEPDATTRQAAATAYAEAAAPLVALLRDGQQAGVVRRGVDPEAAVGELLRGLLGAALLTPDAEPRFDCLWHGLLKVDV